MEPSNESLCNKKMLKVRVGQKEKRDREKMGGKHEFGVLVVTDTCVSLW